MSESVPPNPYVGPRSLHYGENIFGREREARQLVELLIAERIVLLYSPSGAGKTSLIEAALIRAIERRFQIFPVMRVSQEAVGEIRPANRYVFSALLSLERDFPSNPIPPDELGRMTFGDYLSRREAERVEKRATFLIFDQFEEILTVDPMKLEEKMEFFDQVGEALRDLKRWALFSMREDHVAALDPYLRPIPTRLKATFRLDLLNVAGARAAIEEPARSMGVTFTPEATGKLVDDLREVLVRSGAVTKKEKGPYVEPVQLQVVCRRMWAKLPAGTATITEACVAGSSDVDTALADYYADEVREVAEKTRIKERAIREWCDCQLITESGLRGQVMQEPGSTQGLDEKAIGLLIDAHLMRREDRRGVTWLELAHDRMVKPVRVNNAKWIQDNLSPFQLHAALWSEKGKPSELCLRGQQLAEAQDWKRKHPEELTADEREFLTVSLHLQAAEAEKIRQRQAHLRLTIAALAIITALAVFACIESFRAWRAQGEAIGQTGKAEMQRKIATAQTIAAHALQLRDEQLDTALLMAIEAHEIGRELPETRGSLLTAAYYNPRLKTFLHTLPSSPAAFAFSPDGLWLAIGDIKGGIELRHATERGSDQKLPGIVKGAVRAITFSGDSRRMAVCSKDTKIAVRDTASGEVRNFSTLDAREEEFQSLAFSNDATMLASGAAAGLVVVWNLATGVPSPLSPANSPVKSEARSVTFNSAGTMLAAGHGDGTISTWSRKGDEWVAEGRVFAHEHPHDPFPNPDAKKQAKRIAADDTGKGIRCLAFGQIENYLAAGRESGVVDLYDLANPDGAVNPIAFGRHDNTVSGLAFSLKPGTDTDYELMTSSFDGTLRLWKMPSMVQDGPPFTGHVGRVLGVAFSRDRMAVSSVGTDCHAILWDPWKYVVQTVRSETTEPEFSVAFSPGAAWEADGYNDGSVVLVKRDPAKWGLEDSRLETNATKLIEGSPGLKDSRNVPVVKFSGDGKWLATTTLDGKLRVFDLSKPPDGANPWPHRPDIDVISGDAAKRITAVGMSLHGDMIAAALGMGEDGTAQIIAWRVAPGGPTEQIFGKDSNVEDTAVFAVEFSMDGKQIITAGDGKRAVIWTLEDKVGVSFPQEHEGAIRSVAFNPTGDKFVTASGDNTLMLWDVKTERRDGPPLKGHQAPVLTAAFSPNGRLIASGSDDHSVILWDVAKRQQTGQLIAHYESVRAVAFRSDSERLYTSSWGGESLVWELDPDALKVLCRTRANRVLTQEEWAAYIPNEPYPKSVLALPEPVGEFRKEP